MAESLETKSQDSYIELSLYAHQLNILDDVRNLAKANPSIVSQIKDKINHYLLLGDTDDNSFVHGVIDDSADTKLKLAQMAQDKNLDVVAIIYNIQSSALKIIYSDPEIRQFIIEKRQKTNVLKQRSEQSLRSLGGETGTLTRSVLRSFIGSMDMIGKANMVKKAYLHINRTGWDSIHNMIKTMGGTVYDSDTSVHKNVIVLATTSSSVKFIDDLTDDEFAKLGVNSQYFIDKETKEIDKVNRTIIKNDLSRAIEKLKPIYDKLPRTIKERCNYDYIKQYINDLQTNSEKYPDSHLFFLESGYDGSFKDFKYAISDWASSQNSAVTNILRSVETENMDMNMNAIWMIRGRVDRLNQSHDLLMEGGFDQLIDPNELNKLHTVREEVIRTTYGILDFYESLLEQDGSQTLSEEDRHALQRLFTKYQTTFIEPLNRIITDKLAELDKDFCDQIKMIFEHIHKIKPFIVNDSKKTNSYQSKRPIEDDEVKSIDDDERPRLAQKSSQSRIPDPPTAPTVPTVNPTSVQSIVKDRKNVKKRYSSNLLTLDKFIKTSINRGIRFIIIPLGLCPLDGDMDLHANVVMIDVRNKTVEHYEPHGTSQYIHNRPQMIEQILSIFGNPRGHYSGKITSLTGFKVSTLSTILSFSNKGAQSISNYPYCSSWCMYMSLLRVLHPSKNFVEIETMSKSSTNIVDDDVYDNVNGVEMLESRYTLLDGCDLRERIINFTIFLSRIGNKTDVQFSTGIFGSRSDESILEIINDTITNAELTLRDRSGVMSVIEKIPQYGGKLNGSQKNQIKYRIKKYRY
jgi:hypothetical protein